MSTAEVAAIPDTTGPAAVREAADLDDGWSLDDGWAADEAAFARATEPDAPADAGDVGAPAAAEDGVDDGWSLEPEPAVAPSPPAAAPEATAPEAAEREPVRLEGPPPVVAPTVTLAQGKPGEPPKLSLLSVVRPPSQDEASALGRVKLPGMAPALDAEGWSLAAERASSEPAEESSAAPAVAPESSDNVRELAPPVVEEADARAMLDVPSVADEFVDDAMRVFSDAEAAFFAAGDELADAPAPPVESFEDLDDGTAQRSAGFWSRVKRAFAR